MKGRTSIPLIPHPLYRGYNYSQPHPKKLHHLAKLFCTFYTRFRSLWLTFPLDWEVFRACPGSGRKDRGFIIPHSHPPANASPPPSAHTASAPCHLWQTVSTLVACPHSQSNSGKHFPEKGGSE